MTPNLSDKDTKILALESRISYLEEENRQLREVTLERGSQLALAKQENKELKQSNSDLRAHQKLLGAVYLEVRNAIRVYEDDRAASRKQKS